MEIKRNQPPINDSLERVRSTIESSITRSGITSSFQEVMRQTLGFLFRDSTSQQFDTNRWVFLPEFCFTACDGKETVMDQIATAWLLYYTAAHLMDHVEDRDPIDFAGSSQVPGIPINAATGLFFLANQVLGDLIRQTSDTEAAVEIYCEFQKQLLLMSNGQHRDLTENELDLKEYEAIAQLKSGSFFGLACWSGARMATTDKDLLEAYRSFGMHLGLLMQILDDLEDYSKLSRPDGKAVPIDYLKIFPTVYALDVLPEAEREELIEKIKNCQNARQAAEVLVEKLESVGAGLFVLTEIERHRSMALQVLTKANAKEPARESLSQLLNSLVGDRKEIPTC